MSARVLLTCAPRLRLEANAPTVLAPEVESAVAQAWNAACAERPGLFNGQVLSAVGLKHATLRVRPVEYRWYVAQREHASLRALLDVQPVGVSGLVFTTDGCVLLGRRAADVTQYPGFWEAAPSGSLDARSIVGATEEEGAEALDVEACVRSELYEEAGLMGDDVGVVRAEALLFDDAERTYDIAHVIELTMPSPLLRERLGDVGRCEYSELVVFDPLELAQRIEEPDVVPTTRALWHLFRGRS